MKKKLSINRLAFGNLRARKKQYSLMIIGIVLAMIFSSTAMFFAVCNSDSRQELDWNANGKQDFIIRKCDGFDIEQFKQSGDVTDYAIFKVIAYGYSPDDKFEDGMGIAVHNEKSKEMSHFYFLEGGYPEDENEIAIESDALYRMNITDAKIGDEITLNLRAANGETFLEKETQKTYILSGIIKDRRYNYERWGGGGQNRKCPEYPAAVVFDGTEVGIGGKAAEICLVDFNGKHSVESFVSSYKKYLTQNGISGYKSQILESSKTNEPDIREFGYIISIRSSFNNWSLYSVEAVTILGTLLAAVLAVASCFGVINAFNTNLQERRKQIGMLRAVGTTKRQIINIFGREAFIISLICAPVSVAVGYLFLRLFSHFMGEFFIFKPKWYIIVGICVLCICFVMAAALIPLIFAARVTPMQAIRNTELGRKMKNKKIKSSRGFKPQKLIAKRNLVFHRFRQVSVSLILIATIILSCFCVSLLKSEVENRMQSDNYDYRISGGDAVACNAEFANYLGNADEMFDDGELYDIESNRYVEKANGKTEYAVNWLIEGDYPEYLKVFEFNNAENFGKYEYGLAYYDSQTNEFSKDQAFLTPEEIANHYNELEYSKEYNSLMKNVKYEAEPYGSNIEICSENDLASLENFVVDGKIDVEKLNSGEEVILVAPEEIAFVVSYNLKKEIESYGHKKINNGMEDNPNLGAVEIVREKLPFKAGETAKLSMLIDFYDDDNTDAKNAAYAYDFERYDKEVKIGAIVNKMPLDVFYNHKPFFVTTRDGLSTFGCPIRYELIDININQEITPEIEEQIEAFLHASDYNFFSNFRMKENEKTELKTLVAGVASIIILLFCIAASLVNNALTAKIRESKREIGTLRAVGASARELTMIYIHQLLSMFGVGCGLGFGIYTVVFFAAKLFCTRYYHIEFPFSYHILFAAVICLALFAVCSLNLYIKVKKQMKNSIVENIREL